MCVHLQSRKGTAAAAVGTFQTGKDRLTGGEDGRGRRWGAAADRKGERRRSGGEGRWGCEQGRRSGWWREAEIEPSFTQPALWTQEGKGRLPMYYLHLLLWRKSCSIVAARTFLLCFIDISTELCAYNLHKHLSDKS